MDSVQIDCETRSMGPAQYPDPISKQQFTKLLMVSEFWKNICCWYILCSCKVDWAPMVYHLHHSYESLIIFSKVISVITLCKCWYHLTTPGRCIFTFLSGVPCCIVPHERDFYIALIKSLRLFLSTNSAWLIFIFCVSMCQILLVIKNNLNSSVLFSIN